MVFYHFFIQSVQYSGVILIISPFLIDNQCVGCMHIAGQMRDVK